MAFKLNRCQRDYLYWIYPLIILGLIFLTNKGKKDEDETVTITDKDGNIYNSILIGTQVWMKENLKATKYNDDSSIPNITEGTAWSNLNKVLIVGTIMILRLTKLFMVHYITGMR